MKQVNHPSAVIIGANPHEQGLIHGIVDDLLDVIGAEATPEAFNALLSATSPDVVLLYVDNDPKSVFSLARELDNRRHTAVLFVSGKHDADIVNEAMKAGAQDFAVLDPKDPSELRRAVSGLRGVHHTSEASGHGKIVTFFGAKGGSGTTTISSNLAVSLLTHHQRRFLTPRKVALLDFDLDLGNVVAFMDVRLRFNYTDFLGALTLLDEDYIDAHLTSHPTGLKVLAQTEHVDDVRDISAPDMERVLLALTSFFDFIVIDGIKDFGERSIVALDMADVIILNATQEMLAFKNAKRCLKLFEMLGYGSDKVKLVINRYKPSRQMDRNSISTALGRHVDGTIRNHYSSVMDSINRGTVLVAEHPRTKVAKDIRRLAELVVDPTTRSSSQSWIPSFMKGRR